jgi:predicted acylesterase/phospholipase RssA
VLKYLEEHNYEITEIAGTSIGSIVGLMLANGLTYSQMYAIAHDLGYLSVLDWTTKQ